MITLRFILTRISYLLALLPLLTFKKILNLLKAFLFFLFRSKYTVESPSILILNITNRCNYTCIMCAKQSSIRRLMNWQNPCDMSFDVLEKFLRKHADYLCLVRLHGGEPLYYKDITRLIDLLNEVKIPFNIITNGSLLTEAISKKLVKSYCVGIGFSLDAANPETYSKMRKGGDLNVVTNNIELLCNLKKKFNSKRPVLSASMCTFSFNVGEISDLVKLCDRLNISALSVGEGADYKTDDINKNHLIANNIEITHHHIKEAAKEAKKRGIIFRTKFPSLSKKQFKDIPYHAGKIKPRNCFNLYSVAWFLPNYDVIACSHVSTIFENIKNTDFDKIWNSDKFGHVQSRIEYRKNQTPSICNDCNSTGSFFS